jgi:hypothetical protein
MMQCIYCLAENPQDHYKKSDHIIPQSFGRFINNFTLKNLVCDSCNQYFGDNIELALARDTIEGASRFEHGVKKPEEFKSAGKQSRLTIKLAEGEFKGAYVYRYYCETQEKVVIAPVPQFGFLKTGSNQYEYFLFSEVPDKRYLEENGFNLDAPRAIITCGIEVDAARVVLSQRGMSFNPGGEVGTSESLPEDLLCKVEALVDSIVLRAVAKIAFNYLAYREGRDFLLHEAFNPIRAFIRKGEGTTPPLIQAMERPVLAGEPIEGQRLLGHLITVDWAVDNVSIIAQVSLFNWMTYSVSLARDFPGERRDIQHGHLFNIPTRTILPLRGS